MAGTKWLNRRKLAAVAIALLLCWLSVSTGMAGLLRVARPETALKFAPGDSRALSALGDVSLQARGAPESTRGAADMAKRAWLRDATNPVAVRLASMTQPVERQRKMLRYAERLSRRDVVTQIWLIEDAVQRDKAEQALVHYDTALRTSASSRHLLFPILASAVGEADLEAGITKMLQQKPDWGTAFLYEAVNTAPDPARLMSIFGKLKSSGVPLEADLSLNLLRRVVRDHRYDLAPQAYRLAGGVDVMVGKGVADGDFTRLATLQPVDWALSTENGLYVDRVPRPDGGKGFALSVRADAGALGNAARQLLLLPPGTYQFQSKSGNIPVADLLRASWTLRCAKSEAIFADIPIQNSGMTTGKVVIPVQDCAGQWLSLAVRAEASSDGSDPWVTDVSVSRIN